MSGYGRGHYGADQLDRQGSGAGWLKFAAIVGVGAGLWYWSRKRVVVVPVPMEMLPSSLAPPPASTASTALEQIARSRGFASVKEYEDSVLAIARDLRSTGAKIDLPPHLQYLTEKI